MDVGEELIIMQEHGDGESRKTSVYLHPFANLESDFHSFLGDYKNDDDKQYLHQLFSVDPASP